MRHDVPSCKPDLIGATAASTALAVPRTRRRLGAYAAILALLPLWPGCFCGAAGPPRPAPPRAARLTAPSPSGAAVAASPRFTSRHASIDP